MTLTSAEHARVHQETKRARNAAARARREVGLLEVHGPDGERLVVAHSRSWPGRGYLLTADGAGGWRCACPAALIRGGPCAHTRAALAAFGPSSG